VKPRCTELKELARTAGVEVVDEVLQVRRAADPKYLIGKRQARRAQPALDAADSVTSSSSTRSSRPARPVTSAQATSMKVLDRTQLILDIFAQRARAARASCRSSWPS
jgi:GTP-binding protein HflX